MERGNNKKLWKNVVILLAIVVVAVILGIEIKQINEAYPQVRFVDVERDGEAEVQPGVNMRILAAAMFSMEESQMRYGKKFVEEIGDNYLYRTIEVSVCLENKTDDAQSVALYDIYLEQEDYCNGLAPEVFYGIGNESDYVTIEAGEELKVTLGYLIYKKQFRDNEWNSMTVEDFWIVRQRYPEKIKWRLSENIEETVSYNGTALDTYEMTWYDSEHDKENFAEICKDDYIQQLVEKRKIDAVRLYKEEALEILLYTDETELNSYLMINGQELPFALSGDYSIRPYTYPQICSYDINNDSVPDILVHGAYGDAPGMGQDVYLSDGNGNYKELGSVSWDFQYSYEKIPYEITLLDDFKVQIELEEFQISEIIELNESFAEVAEDLKIYDRRGKVTEYGLEWQEKTKQSGYQHPYEKEISYIISDDGTFRIRVVSPISAGYSDYDLGGGFVFEWTIQDEKYQLLNIEFMK